MHGAWHGLANEPLTGSAAVVAAARRSAVHSAPVEPLELNCTTVVLVTSISSSAMFKSGHGNPTGATTGQSGGACQSYKPQAKLASLHLNSDD